MTDFPWDDYVFIDCETGGLNWRTDPLLEVTYAVGTNEPVTLFAVDKETLSYCEPAALEVNKYLERFLEKTDDDIEGKWYKVPQDMGIHEHENDEWDHWSDWAWLYIPEQAGPLEWNAFRDAVKGKTWVGANPRFDVAFMEAWFDPEPIEPHYRLFDISAYAAGARGAIKPIGFSTIHADFDGITVPDHTSRNDVLATRDVFTALMVENGNLPSGFVLP